MSCFGSLVSRFVYNRQVLVQREELNEGNIMNAMKERDEDGQSWLL